MIKRTYCGHVKVYKEDNCNTYSSHSFSVEIKSIFPKTADHVMYFAIKKSMKLTQYKDGIAIICSLTRLS